MSEKIISVAVSGYFDPIHVGHLEYLKIAKSLGDKLVVIVNSDYQAELKKGKSFMPEADRLEIVGSLRCVDEVFLSIDKDKSVCKSLEHIKPDIFANGGDRTKENIPEMDEWPNVDFVFGVGGEVKQNSSSWILEEWKTPKTIRNWGWYRVLDDKAGYKVKELVIEPGKSLSMQRHQDRSEHWYILKGTCTMNTINVSSDYEEYGKFKEHQTIRINKQQWHQGCNETKEPCHILEVQYGDRCVEDDIERRS